MSATINPFSSNFKYAAQYHRCCEITWAITKSTALTLAVIAVAGAAFCLGCAAALSLAGAIASGVTPLGAGLGIAAITGIALTVLLLIKVNPPLIQITVDQFYDTHRLIWY